MATKNLLQAKARRAAVKAVASIAGAQHFARDDAPCSEDQSAAPTYTPFAVEFAAGAS
jgi:hypothetical protein